MRAFRVGLLAAFVAVCSPEVRAKACVQAAAPPVSTFGPYNRVPGNLVFFRLNESATSANTFALIDVESGATVRTHSYFVGNDHVFAPVEPIPAGRRVALISGWQAGWSGQDPEESSRYEFMTTDHVDVVLSPLELRVVDHDGRNVTFAYDLPQPYEAIRHLIMVSHAIDGATPGGGVSLLGRFEAQTSCEGTVTEDSCGGVHTWSPGKHEATVSIHLFGLTDQPEPARVAFETTCEEEGCTVSERSAPQDTLLLAGLGLLFARRRRKHAQ
jgi:MYXO-CTERM domain-containing protein